MSSRIFIFQFEKGYDRRRVYAFHEEGKEFWHGTIDKMWALDELVRLRSEP